MNGAAVVVPTSRTGFVRKIGSAVAVNEHADPGEQRALAEGMKGRGLVIVHPGRHVRTGRVRQLVGLPIGAERVLVCRALDEQTGYELRFWRVPEGADQSDREVPATSASHPRLNRIFTFR